MLSQASTVWGSMTQMVKDAKGENSKTFKAMFLAQQTMAIAQQIINTELAAGATTAQTGIFGIPAASAIFINSGFFKPNFSILLLGLLSSN